MRCPSCQEPTLGLDCPRCGHELPARCPGCQAAYGRMDRACRECGRDLTTYNLRSNVRIRFPINLIPEDFEHPADRGGLKRLRRLGPLRELARIFIKKISEPMIRARLLGSAVQVSETQFPRMYAMVKQLARVLDMPPVAVFMGRSTAHLPAATALTWGTEDQSCIFVSATQYRFLTEGELRFVVGREMGHIKSRHVIYLTMARTLSTYFGTIQSSLFVLLAPLFEHMLVPWQRAAEITADRVGLICCQSLASALSALLKGHLTGEDPGHFLADLNLEELLRQHKTLREKFGWFAPDSEMPVLIERLEHLGEFYYSRHFARIFSNVHDPARPRVLCPGCKHFEILMDPKLPFNRFACSACGKPIPVDGLTCPHCLLEFKVESPGQTLGSSTCPGCKKNLLAGIDSAGEPVETFYKTLGLPMTATARDIESAFVTRAGALSPTGAARRGRPLTDQEMVERMKLHTAYKTLIDPTSREDYDMRLIQLRSEAQFKGASFVADLKAHETCPVCVGLKFGRFCTLCGSGPVTVPSTGGRLNP